MKSSFFSNFDSPATFVNKLRITFYGMAGLTVPAFLYLYLENRNGTFSPSHPELISYLQYSVPILCLVNAIIAYWQYGRKVKEARTIPSLKERLSEVLKASFYKFFMLEFTSIVAVVSFYLTGNMLSAGAYIGMIILFAMSNPSIYSVLSDLRLSKADADLMRNNAALY